MGKTRIDPTSLSFLYSLATGTLWLDKHWVTPGSLMPWMIEWGHACGISLSMIGRKRLACAIDAVLGPKKAVDFRYIEPKFTEHIADNRRRAYFFDRDRVMKYIAMHTDTTTQAQPIFNTDPKESPPIENQPVKGTTVSEAEISNKIAGQENGTREVTCRFGRVDVLTATEVIEVKRVADYKGAIGQVVCYAREFPSHKPRIHLYGKGTITQYHNAIVAISGEGIRCTMENAPVGDPFAHSTNNL